MLPFSFGPPAFGSSCRGKASAVTGLRRQAGFDIAVPRLYIADHRLFPTHDMPKRLLQC